MSDKNTTGNFMTGIVVGSIVGAVTALLLAPKSGRELRSDLNQQVDTIREKTGGWKETVMEKGSELSLVTMEKGNNVVEVVKEKASQLRSSNSDPSSKQDGWTETSNEVTGAATSEQVTAQAEDIAISADMTSEEAAHAEEVSEMVAEKVEQLADKVNNSMND